ncbi:MAG: MetS family NSS transporter small subunit [Bacteroidota bacterium]
MTAGTIVTMVITIGVIWGGLLFVLVTALKKERSKEQ